jgi:hypothetical protein
MRITRNSVLAVLVLAATALCAQSIIHVPADQSTIQAAINAAATGGTVLVSDGTYFEHIDFKGKAITVTSVHGAPFTILDGQLTSVPVVNFHTQEPNTAMFSGFTVRNGGATFGSGISLSSASPTVVNNIFDGNREGSGGYGAGIGGNNSSPDIERNLFRNNSCDSQYLSGVISFINGSSPIIANNVIVGNTCRGINMTIPVGSMPVVINNTIVGNTSGVRVDARISTVAQLYENNVITGNTIGLEVNFLAPGNEPTWKHNLLSNGTSNYSGISDQTGSNGNIAADPQFVNPPLDLHLISGSPAIDAGESSAPRMPNMDYDGNPRIVDGENTCTATVDLGAFEFQAAPLASFSPNALSFASQIMGATSNQQAVGLSNNGTSCLQMSGFPISGDFSQETSCGATLPAGHACNVYVTFSPIATGQRTGTLSLSSNSPAPPNVALSGTGVAPTYTLSTASTALTANAGGNATTTLNLASTGYNGIVSFTAVVTSTTGTVTAISASASPVTLTAGASGTSTLTVSAAASAASHAPALGWKSGGGVLFGVILLVIPSSFRRKRPIAVFLTVVTLSLAGFLMSCGSGSSASTAQQAARTYTVTVTPTGTGTVTNPAAVSITVNVQ